MSKGLKYTMKSAGIVCNVDVFVAIVIVYLDFVAKGGAMGH